jgi:hypothetical protein
VDLLSAAVKLAASARGRFVEVVTDFLKTRSNASLRLRKISNILNQKKQRRRLTPSRQVLLLVIITNKAEGLWQKV